jgi:hypothetical protein
MLQSINLGTLYSIVPFIKLLLSTVAIFLYASLVEQMRPDFAVDITYFMEGDNEKRQFCHCGYYTPCYTSQIASVCQRVS